MEGESDLSAAHVTETFLEIELVEQWRLDSLERRERDVEVERAVDRAEREAEINGHTGRTAI